MRGIGRRCEALLCGLCAALFALPLLALAPERPIAHFSHHWYENQLPQGTVLSITQQANGVLWLATYGGLVRYSGDGFETIDPRVAPALESSAITAVADDGERGIWVGTLNGGLYRQHAGVLAPVALPSGIESVFGIVIDSSGALWLTTNAGVVRIDKGVPRLLGDGDGFPPRGFYRAIVADPSGGVWIAADGMGVLHWQRQQVRLYDQQHGLPSNAVYSLSVDARGTPWVGTQAGPAYFDQGRFVREPRAAALDGKRIYTLYGDKAGAIWFAPLGMGLCRLSDAGFNCDDRLDGMRGETVRAMYEDREGSLWIGTTSSGVHRLSQSKLITVLGNGESNAVRAVHQVPGGPLWVGTDGGGLSVYRALMLQAAQAYNRQLPSQLLRAVQSDAQGQLWVGGTEGVTRFNAQGQGRNFGLADGLPGTIVFAFAPARDGGMWTGTLQGVARIHGDQVHVLEATRGDDTRALHEAADGRLWIGLRSGLRCLDNGVLSRCGTDGLAGTSVFAFHADANGDMWLGTSVGIMRVRDGKVSRYQTNAGFHGDAVFSLFDDGIGHFWFSSNRGIGRISRAALQALDQGTAVRASPQWYGTADGMLNAQGNGASQTPVARADDGSLWFGTAKGVVVVDPRQMQGNQQPPPVAIERLLIDGEEASLGPRAQFGPGVERLEFQFAAMSYIAPAAVRYRYQLEGFERQWRDAGNSRRAHYTNLPPGDYTFKVIASNNDQVWNVVGDSLHFSLRPHWHQTWWVRLAALLWTLALVAGAVRWRLRVAGQRERALTIEVARRTDALRQANEQLAQIAAQDALTGIANRREFNRCLLQAWQALQQSGEPLSVLLVDVDDFKAYNDNHGHLAGDAALAEVATLLAAQVGGGDKLAARYGGEEFALLLPGTDADAALALASAAVAAVQARAMPHRASQVGDVVTVSIGVATAWPAPGTSAEVLLHDADRALYAAKDAGRNRAVAG